MAEGRLVEGMPYGAVMFAEEDGHLGESLAQAIIEPPVVFDPEGIPVKSCFDGIAPRMEVVIRHVTTTMSKTQLEIQVSDVGGYMHDHSSRIDMAFEGLNNYISYLNKLEAGMFDPDSYVTGEEA